MGSQSRWARAAVGSVLVAVCAAACADVLDIQDPKVRTPQAGAAGEDAAPSAAGTATGGGGTANDPLRTPGGAGEGGDTTPGGAGAGAGAGSGGTAGAGGEGGTSSTECQPDEARCGGDAQKTPEICDETGHWIANPDEADGTDGDCTTACLDGKCKECSDSDAPRCKDCADGATDCNSNQRQTCVGGVWTDNGDACEQFCVKGGCETAPSCGPIRDLRTTCNHGPSCCDSLLVPGGTFNRFLDEDFETPYPATVGAFYLDKFEVTVGRMRQFVNAFELAKADLKDGDGKAKSVTGDQGWSSTYVLPANKDDLAASFKCDEGTWSDAVIDNNDLPINCVSFNIAYAFCIWDGGRLPTEAEWEFAAAGGMKQQTYPWAPPDNGPAITPEYANYSSAAPLAPGSKPLGDGRWGQSDLAGNLNEWVLDYYSSGFPESCQNCVNAAPSGNGRVFKGGAYGWDAGSAVVGARDALDPTLGRNYLGFRCARDIE